MVTQRSPQRRRDLILKGNNLQTGTDRGRRAQAVAWVSLVQAEIGTGDLQTVGIGDGKPRPWRGSLSSRPRSWGGSLSSRPNQPPPPPNQPNQPPPPNRRQAQATTVLQQKTQKAERAKREERAERRESK
jgi:hypothetical protein|uniref:Uncharacterized protein n=1 Tax=Fagus sylvatica TaxID=28930 RepID=A0A2N9HVT9_FAGSY